MGMATVLDIEGWLAFWTLAPRLHRLTGRWGYSGEKTEMNPPKFEPTPYPSRQGLKLIIQDATGSGD